MGIRPALIEDFDELLSLIPQRPPMVMVDTLVSTDELHTVTLLHIQETNIFCKNGVLTEPGLIENIAQTGAVRLGYAARELGKKPPIGYIGAITKLHVHFLPEVGTELRSTVVVEYEIYNASIIRAAIENDGRLACECEMKIFIQPE